MTTYSAVVTTGIYCRPGCSAKPLARNVLTFDYPAAAEAAGFRACHRCRPYRVAGPLPATAPELVCEAVQQIINGALDEDGTEASLADLIGLSARHLRRLFRTHLGVTPDQLARSRRAHFARRLLDDTDLTVLDIAFAAGFGSLRQFNRTMREVFRESPTDLRNRRHRADRLTADGGLTLRLPTVPGYDWDAVLAFLAARLVPGVETVDGTAYRRTISVAGAPGMLEVSPSDRKDGGNCLLLRAHLPYWEGLIHVVDRVGQLLGIERAGLVEPGVWNPFEAGVWAILSARPDRDRLLANLVTQLGTPVAGLPEGLTHTFPDQARVASAPLASTGLPAAEAAAIRDLATAAPQPATPQPRQLDPQRT
jgi:AraC family transcriptional regulator, regulatory protein of adaptative response / DNA-3-methyladenine glycosylase II